MATRLKMIERSVVPRSRSGQVLVEVSYPEQRVLHILDMLGFHTYYDYA